MAAVGGNAPVIGLLVNLFVGFSLGSNVIIAKSIGQNDAVSAGQKDSHVQIYLLRANAVNAVSHRHSAAIPPIRGGNVGDPGALRQQPQNLRRGLFLFCFNAANSCNTLNVFNGTLLTQQKT